MKSKTKNRTVHRPPTRRTVKRVHVTKKTVMAGDGHHSNETETAPPPPTRKRILSIARPVELDEPRIYRVHLEGDRHIVITVDKGVAKIDSNFKRVVGPSQMATESDIRFNLAVDGMETMVSQAAICGVDTDSPEFVQAISFSLGELEKKYT
jgi:hypothetical protein